jgi:hypothetical protein
MSAYRPWPQTQTVYVPVPIRVAVSRLSKEWEWFMLGKGQIVRREKKKGESLMGIRVSYY